MNLKAFAILLILTTVAGIRPARRPAPVQITVNAAGDLGPWEPAWSCFGCDEPNYAYQPDGHALLRELGKLGSGTVYFRTHNLLTSGDGKAALKWGSTNLYTEDSTGRPVYDFTIVDRIFDACVHSGVKPLVEIGFMPEALTTGPLPYRHRWPNGPLFTGWTYPPHDYARWAEIVGHWARHETRRYGRREVAGWLWEVWNEPDIGYWHGTPDEYFRLYDFAASALRRALPEARIGGPETTGGGQAFLRRFLAHCASGANPATGGRGAPLDFISFHPKGAPRFVDGHVRMGLGAQLAAIDSNLAVIAESPRWRSTPVIFGESDPEGCAACSADQHPEGAYREESVYGAYNACAYRSILSLARARGLKVTGIVTWAFEFEGSPWFPGMRELATHGIDKPVLNVFRLLGRMKGLRIPAESSGSLPAAQIVAAGVRVDPDIGALAAQHDNTTRILLWNYHDDDVAAPVSDIRLHLTGLPPLAQTARITCVRVDGDHANAHAAWLAMGSPQPPAPDQIRALHAAAALRPDGPPIRKSVDHGSLDLDLSLRREGVALIEITTEADRRRL